MRYDTALDAPSLDLTGQFTGALTPTKKWDSIIDFATHRSFCGGKLYPRQQTVLRLIYLETENMTAFDIDVIEEWRENFGKPGTGYGVQPDVWKRVDYLKKNGYTHFPHVQSVMGRRASKGMIGGILGAERLAFLVSTDNPQEFLGIKEGHDIYCQVVATNSIQSKRFQFADIRETVDRCEYLRPYISNSKDHVLNIFTPADLRRMATRKALGMPIQRDMASIIGVALSSTSSSGRGSAGIANFYDEMAHMLTGTGGNRTSEEIYEAYQPSLDQSGIHALTYIPSSPFTKVGKFYELYTVGIIPFDEAELDKEAENGEEEPTAADPEMLILQLPSWELYRDWERSPTLGGPRFAKPVQYNPDSPGKVMGQIRMRRMEKRNPSKFKVERRAQFAEVEDAYLDPLKVDQMFAPFWDGRKLAPNLESRVMYAYVGHADPGRTNANFALAIAHLEEAPAPDKWGEIWPHAIIDYMKVWKPSDYTDHTIDYVQVGKDIESILRNFLSMTRFTFDEWNSASFIANLKIAFPHIRILEAEFNEKGNQKRAERFKSALNLGWVHCYKDDFFVDNAGMGGIAQSLLELELKFLQEKNGKVIKQEIGPVTTKDLADCVMETTTHLLADALDKHAKKLAGSVKPALANREQIMRPGRTLSEMRNEQVLRESARSVLNGLNSHRGRPTSTGVDRERGRRTR